MEEARAVATLDDLPNELLEQIAPDSKPKTISALKLVNRRFYDIFSRDVYFKAYLRNPERYYKCEMKCEKHSGKDVVDEIKSKTLGKWKGYLTLQNLHLENLRCGRIKDCEIVCMPRLSGDIYGLCMDGVKWHDLVDDNDERWLLNLRNDGTIVLVNITNEPKFTVEREPYNREPYGVSAESVLLLNGQVLCISYNMIRVFVLDIVYDGVDIALQHCFDFAFDTLHFQWVAISGKCETNEARRNVLVSLRQYPYIDGMLHFRDLRTGNSLEDISLWDYECLKPFRDVPEEKIVINFIESVEYPWIVMTIADKLSGVTAVLVLNVDKNQTLLLVAISSVKVGNVCITDNVAYVFTSTFDRQKCVDSVKVYRFPLGKRLHVEELQLGKPLCQFDCKGSFTSDFSTPEKFAFIDPEVQNKVHLMSIRDCDVDDFQVSFDFDADCNSLSFVDDLMYVKLRGKIKIFSINGTGFEEVVNWEKILSERKFEFCDPWPVRSRELSKIVLYDSDTSGSVDLAIMYL